MSAWQIPLEAAHAAPGPNFADSFQKGQLNAANLSDLSAQTQQRQSATQGTDLANMATQQQLSDTTAMRKAYIDAQGDPVQTVKNAQAAGVGPTAIGAFQQAHATLQKNLQGVQTDQLANAGTEAQMVGSAANTLKGLPDDASRINQFGTIMAPLVKAGVTGIPAAFPGNDWVDSHIAQATTVQQAITNESARRKTLIDQQQADTQQQNADSESAKTSAQIPGYLADSASKQMQLGGQTAASASDQPSWTNWYNTLPPAQQRLTSPMFSPAAKAVALRMGLTSDQQVTSDQAAANAAQTAKYQSSESSQGQQRVNIEANRNQRENQIYEQTYGAGANPALVGVDPKLRVQATKEAQGAADEYVKAMQGNDAMQGILELAKGGNKVAYSYAPTEGVLTMNTAAGVKRVNLNEIKAYGGAGSAMDKVQGWLGKQTSGASIPSDILTNMQQLNQAQADNATKYYNNKLGGVNQNYQSHFKPVGTAQSAAAPAPMPASLSASDVGKVYTSRSGQKLKITAVNPKDPTQFQSEVQK